MAMKKRAKKRKGVKIPWIPSFYKPNYRPKLPEIDFSDPFVRQITFIVLMVFSALMSSGIIFMMVNPPPALITIYEKPTVILPNLDRQTLSEGIVVFAMFIMASLGLFLIRRSTEFFTEEEARGLWLGLGFALLLISSLALTYFLMIKMGIMK